MEFRKPNLQVVPVPEGFDDVGVEASPSNMLVSKFDYSVENHFKMLDKIALLSGESESEYDEADIQRWSSSITFVRAWRDFRYQPRAIRFACETTTPQEKDVTAQMNLPQFSSVAIPKEMSDVNNASTPLRKDFVMCIGGNVWALDWCPKVHPICDFGVKTEFIAIAAHPPESSYHKIGSPLSGRGLIQIWCLLNVGVKDDDAVPLVKVKPRKYSRNDEASKRDVNHNKPIRPRGRPRKRSLSVGKMDHDNQCIQNPSVQLLEDSNMLVHADDVSQLVLQVDAKETDINSKSNKVKKSSGRSRKKPMEESLDNFDTCFPVECLKASSQTDKNFVQTTEQVSREDDYRNQNAHGECAFTGEHLMSGGTENINYNPTKPGKLKVRKRLGKSVDNLDGSDPYPQPLAFELPEHAPKLLAVDKGSLETTKIILEEDDYKNDAVDNSNCKALVVHVASDPSNILPGSIEKDHNRNLKTYVKQYSRRRARKSIAVEPPEHAPKLLAVDKESLETPKIVAEEDDNWTLSSMLSLIKAHRKAKKLNPSSKQAQAPVSLSCNNSDGFEAGVFLEHNGNNALDNSNCSNQDVQALAVHLTSDPSKILSGNEYSRKTHKQVTEKDHNHNLKNCVEQRSRKSMRASSRPRLTKCQTRIEHQENGAELHIPSLNCRNSLRQDPLKLMESVANPVSFETVPNSGSIPDDVALPRLVMGLAHNGRVAWDVKWRPFNPHAIYKHILGYLAVLLGSGALEVWEVPHPHTTKAIYSSCQREGTDPRFLKLKPIFMCSVLKSGDRQSIPLTVEWSASAPHDLILVGCHDGLVALWKFVADGASKDTRPLLCFSADTAPIRALKWAPVTSGSDPESANVIVTAGHKGVKFWDIRDPVLPLWTIPSQKLVYSLDWLPDPRCVVYSDDDGEIVIYSLLNAASDVPVTGMPTVKTEQYGSHRHSCSSPVWSIQASSLAGMVAYCCADGRVVHFQLTTKAVEKDYRHRQPHYLCGSLAEEESVLTIVSPLPGVPLEMKKSSNQDSRAKERISKQQTSEEHSSEGRLVASQKSHASKTKGNPKAKTSLASICVAENEGEKVNEEVKKEAPHPKSVAMHRVRWNMNKGSERWLCYGGAAGILRCQEIQ